MSAQTESAVAAGALDPAELLRERLSDLRETAHKVLEQAAWHPDQVEPGQLVALGARIQRAATAVQEYRHLMATRWGYVPVAALGARNTDPAGDEPEDV